MTIRQFLERRGHRTVAAAVVFLLAAGWLVSSGPRVFVLRFVFAVLMGAVVLAAVWSLFEIPCPHCSRSLGRTGFCAASGSALAGSRHCPHCKVGFENDVKPP